MARRGGDDRAHEEESNERKDIQPSTRKRATHQRPRPQSRCGFQLMRRIVRYCVRAVDARLYSPHMAVTDDYLKYVLEQLAGLGRVSPRRMFGAVGLYHEERFFGLISRDTLYFKVNDSNRGDYESRGMQRFRPFPDKPYRSMTYYEVPADTLEDADECMAWARRSLNIAAVPTKPATAKTEAPRPAARRRKKRAR